MSVDIAWDKVTQGPDGEALAEKIREFIHSKFQQVPLPRFLKSVQVHSFAFGSACPQVDIKDLSDPLPDFYEDDESDESSENNEELQGQDQHLAARTPAGLPAASSRLQNAFESMPSPTPSSMQEFRSRFERAQGRAPLDSHVPEALSGTGTPGIPGGTSNFSYFHHLPMGGLSGTHTPLAIASGTQFSPIGWHHDTPHSAQAFSTFSHRAPQQSNVPIHNNLIANDPSLRPSTATSRLTSPDADPISNPASPEHVSLRYQQAEKVSDDPTADMGSPSPITFPAQQSQPQDLQVVARVQYSGDVRMMLTAEILLDYPMPSFVGIPLKLSITGITFDGVAILAYIKKRMHFCFLDTEDANTLVGDHVTEEQKRTADPKTKLDLDANGLIREIRIESEIGRQESGKQVLKNVGKVEKFVLEQIRKIFEEEFVFPSFWTFLV